MEWVIAALGVVVLGLAALAAAGKLGSLPAPDDDTYAPQLPAGDITPATLRSTRFGVALRGYDMRQVDALLDRLADQLEGRGGVVVDEVSDATVVDELHESAVDPAPSAQRALLDPVDEVELVGQSAPARLPDAE